MVEEVFKEGLISIDQGGKAIALPMWLFTGKYKHILYCYLVSPVNFP